MTSFWEIGQKPHFLAFLTIFGHAQGVSDFFSKIRLRHFCPIRPTKHHANFQKNPMSGSREKRVTDRRTDGRMEKGLFIGPLMGVQKCQKCFTLYSIKLIT